MAHSHPFGRAGPLHGFHNPFILLARVAVASILSSPPGITAFLKTKFQLKFFTGFAGGWFSPLSPLPFTLEGTVGAAIKRRLTLEVRGFFFRLAV